MNKIKDILLKILKTFFLSPLTEEGRTFVFIYILGIASSIMTVPETKGAHMFENAPYELFIDAYLVALLLCLVPKVVYICRKRIAIRLPLKVMIFAFLYTLYIIDMFCFVKFGTTINPSMLLLVGETTGNEASEFLSSYVTMDMLLSPVGVIMLIPLLHLTVFFISRRYMKVWSHKMKRGVKVGLAILTVIVSMVMIYWCCGICIENKQLFHKVMTCETVGQVEHELAARPKVELYQPTYRLAFSIYCNQLAAQQLDRLFDNVDKVQIDSCSVKSPNIVFIIGESCNLRHSQLYGYDKTTTPYQVAMEKTGLLTKFSDVVAPWNLTSFVFKHLMTTYCVGDEGDWCDYPLFGEVFRKAGYTVSFFTNQFLLEAKQAVYDFSGGFFINNPELSKVQFDLRSDKLHLFDEALLTDYDQSYIPHAVAEGKPCLTIFHLMGQHVNYRIRCPNSKKKWGRNDYPNDNDLTPKRKQTMADYDNATWYNDSVVNQIIERFKGTETVVVFFSDHGEEVFGPGARHFFGRMHKTDINKRLADEEFRTPMWIYTTPEYAAKHPDVVEAIKAAKDKRYMSDAQSHLLMGLAGIHTSCYKPEYDLLSPQYNANRKRMLKHEVDYDTLK